jgi:hydroxymethylglutaryl-CoA lyase
MVKLIECPRDAMQGMKQFIPTASKIEYLNLLLKVGFYALDFGSFVSPKAIPQMRDTAEVLDGLNIGGSNTKLLAIVANLRGAIDASQFDQIHYLGYPFSISETFQLRNTNATIEESLERVESILEICGKTNKEMVLYLSMGFGNPYGDPWSPEIATKWISYLLNMGVKTISISDTVAIGKPESIGSLFKELYARFSNVQFGAHLHTQMLNWEEKVSAAYENGCRRFDGAILGYGGCPMADDELTGNMPTEKLIDFCKARNELGAFNEEMFHQAREKAIQIFTP